jgi:hypothetical protein
MWSSASVPRRPRSSSAAETAPSAHAGRAVGPLAAAPFGGAAVAGGVEVMTPPRPDGACGAPGLLSSGPAVAVGGALVAERAGEEAPAKFAGVPAGGSAPTGPPAVVVAVGVAVVVAVAGPVVVGPPGAGRGEGTSSSGAFAASRVRAGP